MYNCDKFKKAEMEILDVAYQTFVTKEFALKKYDEKWSSAGFEGWVVEELLIQFEIRDMTPEKRQDPDLVINGIDIEVKGCAHPKNARSAHWLIEDYLKHPKREIRHLWAFSKAKIIDHLEDFLIKNNIIACHRDLGDSGWQVMISKQTERTPDQLIDLPYRSWSRNRKLTEERTFQRARVGVRGAGLAIPLGDRRRGRKFWAHLENRARAHKYFLRLW